MRDESIPVVIPSEKSIEPPVSEPAKWHMEHKPYTVSDYLKKIGVNKNGGCNEDKGRAGDI